jgi:hypothetical protein
MVMLLELVIVTQGPSGFGMRRFFEFVPFWPLMFNGPETICSVAELTVAAETPSVSRYIIAV